MELNNSACLQEESFDNKTFKDDEANQSSYCDPLNSLEKNYGISGAQLEEEEKKIAQSNDEEYEKIVTELREAKELHEKELQQRHEKLMSLLEKSQIYTDFVFGPKDQESVKKNSSKRSRQNKSVNKENESRKESSSKRRKSRAFGSDLNNIPAKKSRVEAKEDDSSSSSSQGSQDNVISRDDHPKLFENGLMRPYQVEGYTWLKGIFENGVNGILADEMGLGKTIQAIAFLCHLIEMEVPGPFLVIAPLSTLSNWISEFRRFSPKVPLLLYHGPEKVRKEKQKEFFRGHKVEGVRSKIAPVVITSYEVVIRDTKKLSKIYWRYIIIDEGHRLKNHKCILTRSLNKFLNSARLILTGTPLQNNLAELWSLLNFLMPELFDSLEVFECWFCIEEMMGEGSKEWIVQQERERQIVATLHKILAPFLLRRVKADVELGIPPKREMLVYTPMTPLQFKLYTATLKRDISSLLNRPKDIKIEYGENGRSIRPCKVKLDYSVLFDNSNSDDALEKFLEAIKEEPEEKPGLKERTCYENFKMQNIMMQLRKIVNHPYLVSYPLDKDGNFKVDDKLLYSCGKLQVFDQLLKELHVRGHRVLIFSQMTKMLDIIEDYLTLRPDFSLEKLLWIGPKLSTS